MTAEENYRIERGLRDHVKRVAMTYHHDIYQQFIDSGEVWTESLVIADGTQWWDNLHKLIMSINQDVTLVGLQKAYVALMSVDSQRIKAASAKYAGGWPQPAAVSVVDCKALIAILIREHIENW